MYVGMFGEMKRDTPALMSLELDKWKAITGTRVTRQC